jgi:hypothetical protein
VNSYILFSDQRKRGERRTRKLREKNFFSVLLSLIEHVDSCDILPRCFGGLGLGVMFRGRFTELNVALI